MSKVSTRGILLTAAILTALAVAAAPAQATLTPVGGAISASSTDSSFMVTAGVVIRCPTSTFTGIIAANGLSVSGTLEFSNRPGVETCVITILGSSSSADVTCRLRITLRSVSSVRNDNSSGDVVIDAANPANACSISLPVHGCTITVATQTLRNVFTLRQGTRVLAVSRANVAATGSGGLCGSGARTSVFTATYRVSTAFSIS